MTIISPLENSTYNSAVGISAAVLDAGLGIAAVEYRIDDRPMERRCPLLLLQAGMKLYGSQSLADNGNHTVDFRASDTAGHTTIPMSAGFTVQMDTTPPVTTLSIETQKYEANGQIFVSGNTLIALNATDDFSGVSKTEYQHR